VLNFRSCSGELNRRPRFYHAGDTGDLDEVVDRLVARDGALRLGLVGVSLGGNVLLKWLGERHHEVPAPVVGAVAISTPFALAASAEALDRGLGRLVYTPRFLRTMRRKAREKAARHPGFVDVRAVAQARTFAAYDRAVTAPLHGFADEHDYWARASSGPWLTRVRCPTLLINAGDDPLVPVGSWPTPSALPPAVRVARPSRGGHAGFIEGRWPWRVRSWAERAALEFLSTRLVAREACPPRGAGGA
jgi:predicted alpha/beta-fold hydrolase